jgi:RNA polymerase sigma-70 factor (ECF subfamily)
VSTWLFAMARNRVIDRMRRRAVRPEVVVDLTDRALAHDDLELDRVLEAWQLAEGLSALSDDHRAAIVEVYYRGRSVAEAAAELGIPEGTVKSRVYYGLKALRLRLEEMGVVS